MFGMWVGPVLMLLCIEGTRESADSPDCKTIKGKRYLKTPGDYKMCNDDVCPPFKKGHEDNCFCCHGDQLVNGSWATWNTWSTCSSARDDSIQYRIRTCSNPPPLRGGKMCLRTGGKNSGLYEYQQVRCQLHAYRGVYLDQHKVIWIVCAAAVALAVIAIVTSVYTSRLKSVIHHLEEKMKVSENEITGSDVIRLAVSRQTVIAESTNLVEQNHYALPVPF